MNNGKCEVCGRVFPDHLINVLSTSVGSVYACPICANDIMNEIHGRPKGSHFSGEIAQDYYEEALDYLGEEEQ